MAANLTAYEELALAAYDWAQKGQITKFEGLVPRSFQRLVDEYCIQAGVDILHWNKGNSGRNLSTIVASLEKHGLKLDDSGHLTLKRAPGDVKITKSPPTKPTVAPTALAHSTSAMSPPVPLPKPAIQKAASTMARTGYKHGTPASVTSSNAQKPISPVRPYGAMPAASPSLGHVAKSSSAMQLPPQAPSALPRTSRTATEAKIALARQIQEATARRKAEKRAKKWQEEQEARAKHVADIQRRIASKHAEKLAEELGSPARQTDRDMVRDFSPDRSRRSADGEHKGEKDHLAQQEEEELNRAIQLSILENERERTMDELIRAQLYPAASPDPPARSNGTKNDPKSDASPPMLKKRSSSGRMRAAQSKSHPRPQPTDSPFNDKLEKSTNLAMCPVCELQLPLAQIDSHLDTCLSEKAVEEISRRDSDLGARKDASKKRASETDPILLEGNPTPKKLYDPFENDVEDAEGEDCLIVDGPAYPTRLRNVLNYYPEYDSDEEHPDDEDHIEIAARQQWLRDGGSEQEEDDEDDEDDEDKPQNDAAQQRYLQSVMFASKLGLGKQKAGAMATNSAKTTTPETKPKVTMANFLSAAQRPTKSPQPPQRPKLSIPNSGGMFSEVEFKTPQPDKDCPICFEDFECGDVGVMLPCLCLYHPKCISSWLERKPKNCPSHGDY